MKTIRIMLTAGLLLSIEFTMAQSVDAKRMERDIEVAENILATLLKEGNPGFWMESVKGRFIEDYGVMLTLPQNHLRTSFSYATTVRGGDNDVMIMDADGENVVTVNVPKVEIKKVNRDSLQNLQIEKIIDAMKVFLVDYGNLINQLKPQHKILITNRDRQFHWMRNSEGLSELSAEAKVQDINDYKAGKISRSALLDKITITNRTIAEEKSTDLELFSSIMGRLYQSDLSDTYYTSGNPRYDRLSDFGAIYRMKVYSSTEDNGKHRIHTRNATNLTQQERNAMVKEMYPEFVSTLKENILEYGKTINSLKDNEILMFQVGMTKCEGCNVPKELEVTIKSDILKKYSQGKINKTEALRQFKLNEGEKQ